MPQVELRPCPGCGAEIAFTVTKAYREELAVSRRDPHVAPCGRPCAEGRDVTIASALAGGVHHPNKCECLKVGRGYAG